MSTKKTIQINPELFKISGNKSRKNKEKKDLNLNPIISPNSIKNNLLKRIKEHKNIAIKSSLGDTSSNNKHNKPIEEKKYTDEFYGALDYLSDLTKKQKMMEAKQKSLNTKTLRHYPSSVTPINNGINNGINISLELPPELQENKSNFIPQSNEIFNVNYKEAQEVPYGCLKNGKKKTYREWKSETEPTNIDLPDIIRPPTPPKKRIEETPINQTNNLLQTSREDRLEQIKTKLKKIQEHEIQSRQQSLNNFKTLEKQFSTPEGGALEELNDLETKTTDIHQLMKERENKKEAEIEKNKQYLKKTIKRKFTLGKSDKLRRVSVLLKDRQTRKMVIDTQKELKKTSAIDVKKYLRQHGIIKVGSTCPMDILRKTFETAMMTGDVTNTNKETLLHNFLSHEDNAK